MNSALPVRIERPDYHANLLYSRVETDSGKGLWPDLDYIRRSISVHEIAQRLGLRVRSHSTAHCWRADAHQNGDRSPSLYFTRKNRWRCAVCDARTKSNLDLVQAVLGCDLRRAVEWIKAAGWYVPDVPRGRHAKRRDPNAPRFRVNVTGLPFETLVRSGVFGSLNKPAQILVPVILTFTDPDTGWAVISQRALRRYAGLSFRGVNDGVRELRGIGLLEIDRSWPAVAAIPSSNRYRLNFEAPSFLELQDSTYQKHRAKVDFERECQRQRRAALKNSL
jgi:hypothetical protein